MPAKLEGMHISLYSPLPFTQAGHASQEGQAEDDVGRLGRHPQQAEERWGFV